MFYKHSLEDKVMRGVCFGYVKGYSNWPLILVI